MARPKALPWTENDDANRLLASDDLALLIGMLLDQQFPMEKAFLGPYLLKERLNGRLDAATIAGYEPDAFTEIFKGPPAIHRFPGSMAQRTQAVCNALLDAYGGEASQLWTEAADAKDVLKRLRALPGFGEAKARIFVGILGKRMGVRPVGWETVAADWPSIADIASWDDVAELRLKKKAMKAKG
jgi:uncharacterized HhH-GPD family protein